MRALQRGKEPRNHGPQWATVGSARTVTPILKHTSTPATIGGRLILTTWETTASIASGALALSAMRISKVCSDTRRQHIPDRQRMGNEQMDWDKVVTIATMWLIVGIVAFWIDWCALIPATIALGGTAIVMHS
jgi:hypothetical protein